MILKGRTFTPAPEGQHRGVCVDVADLGMVDSQWGLKPTLRLAFEIDEAMTMDDGTVRPFVVIQRFTASLDDRSNLRKFLKMWRGVDFTAEELKGFDIDKLLGAPCSLVIQHDAAKDGAAYANIVAIMKNPKGVEPLKPSGKYTRFKDREDKRKPATRPTEDQQEAPEGPEDDIPF